MFCKYCAAELEDSAKFCSVCGKPQQAEPAASPSGDGASGKVVCGNCGKALERSWTLCPYCGVRVHNEPADEAKPDIAEKPLAARKQEPEKAGLYDGNEYRGPLDILDSIDWITLNGKDGGNYLIVLGKDEAIPYAILQFEGKHVSVSLKTLGPECTVQREGTFDKPLFEVGSGVTFTLEAGVALVGVSGNKTSVVVVRKDGTFIMNGGSISGNSARRDGGIMSRMSAISGGTNGENSVESIASIIGDFFGDIHGSGDDFGGGVYVQDGLFMKSNGIIYGSDAPAEQANTAKYGAAVYCRRNKRDTTARAGTVMDSEKHGTEGGWE
ncbi:MAG: zinc ribbon domain-containing protein [Treponema sp.]|nr:zinc ribbon domain-containing protein [Treponema sp.]